MSGNASSNSISAFVVARGARWGRPLKQTGVALTVLTTMSAGTAIYDP